MQFSLKCALTVEFLWLYASPLLPPPSKKALNSEMPQGNVIFHKSTLFCVLPEKVKHYS